jgi:transposase
MAKPKSRPQLRLDSAHNCDQAAGIPPQHWSRRFFEHIYCSFDDAQFAGLYQEGGRYPISPTLVACITILQYMFKVSDRVAVENTIMRRDWRIALGRDDDWTGLDPSVLCTFRKRLVEHGWEDMIFGHVLERLRSLGLLQRRQRVRVDATKLLANVARLSRADMIQETLRVVVCELWDSCAHLRQRPDLVRLYEDYGEELWLGRGSEGAGRLGELGRDGYLLLALLDELEQPRERTVQCRELLAQVLEENFERGEDGDVRPLEGDERPKGRVVTPHEPDVRVGKKGGKLWHGDKVHFVETADAERTNFVIDVLVTEPNVPDVKMTTEIVERTRFVLPEAETMLADSGYASGTTSREARQRGVDLVSPPLGNTRSRELFPVEAFEIDFEKQTATCPAGRTTEKWYRGGRRIQIRFRADDCADCPLRAQCTTAKNGRSLNISRDYQQLMADRARAETGEFARLYRLRGPVEATISEAVHCCGLRVSRYRGRAKRALHAILAATALNVRRMLRADAGDGGPQRSPAAPGAMTASASSPVACECARLPRRRWRWGVQEQFAALLRSIPRLSHQSGAIAFCQP